MAQTKFEILTDLPATTQLEIARIQAIDSTKRLTSESNFLTSMAPYLTNSIVLTDSAGVILNAAGNSLPTGYANFKKGALFRLL